MYKIIRFITGAIVLISLGYILTPVNHHNFGKDPGMRYAAVTCKEDSRGVTHCRDSSSGRSWTIHPSPVGTRIS